MTNSTETERAELIAERAELIAKNEAATSWGAAVGARHERIKEIDRKLAALCSFAQDQEPVAWICFDKIEQRQYIITNAEDAADRQLRSNVWTVTPLYLSPPPAAGWDAAIVRDVCHALNEWADFACNASQWMRNVKDGISTPGDALVEMTANYARVIKLSRDADKALRHNAPPDTATWKTRADDLCRDISKMADKVGAEFVPDQHKIDAFNAAHMPDHGGADAGVKPNGADWSEAFNILLLIEHGCDEAFAERTAKQWNDKCRELAEALSHQPAPVAAPPPAAGWDELSAWLSEQRNFHENSIARNDPAIKAHVAKLEEWIKALRHNAPPDTPAGKSAPLEPTHHDFSEHDPQVNCAADHGGADDGVRVKSPPGKFVQWIEREKDGKTITLWMRTAAGTHFRYSALIDSGYGDVFGELEAALSHQPAPVAANASAEARLKEAITDWFGQIADLSTALRQGGPDPMDLQDLSGNLERACEIAGEALEALSAHASDCDKQGWLAKDVEAATKRVAEWNGETTKSEGGVQESPASNPDYNGVKSPALVTAHGLSGQSCPLNQVMPDPSDRTADVTEEELAERIYNAVPAHTASSGREVSWQELTRLTGFPYPTIVDAHRKEARALLDAYGMWRR